MVVKFDSANHASNIVSIQSQLVYGYVGNNIALPAIHLHGLDVISFPTVLFSTHTGCSPIYGEPISNNLFNDLIKGIEAIGILKDTRAIITGYIGSDQIVRSAHTFINKIKQANPENIYVCDPVMGDTDQGLYVSKEVADSIINKLIPISDIITPNQFELKYILKDEVDTIDSILSNIKNNSLLKDKVIIATGCFLKDTPAQSIETIVFSNNEYKRIVSPKVNIEMVGSGDLYTAVFAAQLCKGKDIYGAANTATQIVYKSLVYSAAKNYSEMNSECLNKVFAENNIK